MNTEQINLLVNRATSFLSSESTTLLGESVDLDRKIRDSFIPYPHMFVLCCLMDRQIKSDKAFNIPFDVSKEFGSDNAITSLNSHSEQEYVDLFKRMNLHRYNEKMAKIFKNGLERIATQYNGDASKIWSDTPDSATVVCRFLEFKGCGVKIATMATNILHRTFGIPYSDYSAIDISPDVHVLRIMYRMGIILDQKNTDLAIYAMRGMNPPYPGVCDGFFWRIGRDYCRPSGKPDCNNCPLDDICIKKLE